MDSQKCGEPENASNLCHTSSAQGPSPTTNAADNVKPASKRALEAFNALLATDAAAKVKTASNDALHAFKVFVFNPVGALSGAFGGLGQKRTFGVGLVFGVVFALCVLLGAYRLLPAGDRPSGFMGLLKILVLACVPFASLWGASVAGRKACRAEGSLSHDSFIAGAALLPLGFVILSSSLLGPTVIAEHMQVLMAFTFFAICLTIFMLFAGLTQICKTSERAASVAVPLMLIAAVWLCRMGWKTCAPSENSLPMPVIAGLVAVAGFLCIKKFNLLEKALTLSGIQNRARLRAIAVVTGCLLLFAGIALIVKSADGGAKTISVNASSHSGSLRKSDRELIKDYANSLFDRIESIDIDSCVDGSYQVRIYAASGYQGLGYSTSTYNARVNSSRQKVTSWQYVGE